MILQDILMCDFTAKGINITNGADARTLHRFLRQGILDNHFVVQKCIGYSLTNYKKTKRDTAIERNYACLENMIDIGVNLQDKVFVGNGCSMVQISDIEGVADLSNKTKFDGADPSTICLYTNPYILTTRQITSLKLYLYSGTGYKTMEHTSQLLKGKGKYFPMNVSFSISDYIRVLPTFTENFISYRLDNGFTEDMLRQILLQTYGMYVNTSSSTVFEKEDLQWLSSYGT